MAPNKRDLESTDLNTKQGHPLADSSNVSTPKIPQACDTRDDQSEAICQIEKSTSNLQSANDRDTTISECYKGDFSSRMEIMSTPENKGISIMETENLSPIFQPNIIRPKTPPMAIPVTEIFSPKTVKQVRSSIRALFPNGPPPPKPIVPVKKHKKGDTPYIVGCTKRRRVPEKKSLNVFKGEDYGITKETNSFDNEECCPSKRKCTRKQQYPNWSKSRFNPKSDEIAERLKKNEEIDMILNPKSTTNDTKNTTSYMSEPYKHRPQAFSPLPSTSKDSETIMKNEKQFSESLRYSNYKPCNDDDDDDDELPEIQWESKNISKKKSLLSRIVSTACELTFDEPTVRSEDLNNNNNGGPDEVDLCEIQFDKYMPKKEFAIPESTTEITRNDPIVIDEIDLDTVTETNEPKRVLGEIQEVIETHEIKDDYSSITYEDLHSVPEITEPVDVDALFKDLENFQRRKKKISTDIITIVDTQSQKPPVNPILKQACHNDNPAVKPTPTQEPSVNVSAGVTTTEVIEIPDYVPDPEEPIVRFSREAFRNDVEFVSESRLDIVNYSTSSNSTHSSSSYHSADDENDMGTRLAQFFFGNIIREYENAHSHQESNDSWRCFTYNDRSSNSFTRPRSRSKKTKKSKAPPQESSIVNNENAAPSTNVQKSPTNGERRLGDCPICLDNLARGSIASTTCGHVFCLDCIKTSLRTNGKKCPTCRKTLKGPGYHLIFL